MRKAGCFLDYVLLDALTNDYPVHPLHLIHMEHIGYIIHHANPIFMYFCDEYLSGTRS